MGWEKILTMHREELICRIEYILYSRNSTRITKVPNLKMDKPFDRYFSKEDKSQMLQLMPLIPALGSQRQETSVHFRAAWAT